MQRTAGARALYHEITTYEPMIRQAVRSYAPRRSYDGRGFDSADYESALRISVWEALRVAPTASEEERRRYVYASVWNEARDLRRRSRRSVTPPSLATVASEPSFDPLSAFEARDALLRLEKALPHTVFVRLVLSADGVEQAFEGEVVSRAWKYALIDRARMSARKILADDRKIWKRVGVSR